MATLHRQRLSLWLDLPRTELLERGVVLIRERMDRTTPTRREALLPDLDRAVARLALGHERDALQATRPEGCFCLGLGGRYPAEIFLLATDDGPEAIVRTWSETCPSCPEGLLAGVSKQTALEERARRVTARRVERVFGSPSLRNYQDARLADIEVLPVNRFAFEQAMIWGEDWTSRRSLILAGPVGTGKTHLAVALMRRRVELGQPVLFITMGDYLQRLRDTYDDASRESTAAVQAAARTVDLLVFDDLGAEPKMNDWIEGQLYSLINARINANLPMLITTNYPDAQLAGYVKERIYDRLVEMTGPRHETVLFWGGPSRRRS